MSALLDGRIFILAEMAGAHAGDPAQAGRIIEAAAAGRADAVKIHLFTPSEVAVPSFSYYPLYEKQQIAPETWRALTAQAHGLGLEVFADVFGEESAAAALAYGADGLKIHAADVTNVGLLTAVGRSGKPVLLSVAGSTWIETSEAIAALRAAGQDTIVLMHGFQGYPTALQDSALRRIEALRSKFGLPVGYASHVDGGGAEAGTLPLMAAAAGADVLEVHLTLDRAAQGPDYQSSLDPAPFAAMVAQVRALEPALGSRSLELGAEELQYRKLHKKWLVTTRELSAGETIAADAIALKRTDQPPAGHAVRAREVVGRQTARPLAAHSTVAARDLRTRVAATLACRSESSRLYGKPLQPVGDRPIIQHLIDRLRQVPAIDEIVLAISEGPSHHEYIRYAERQGLRYIVGSEKDVLSRLIQAADLAEATIAVRTTTENPYVYWENLDRLIADHIEQGADLTVTEHLPLGAFLEVISVDALRRSHTHGEDRHRSEFCVSFIVENPALFDIRRVPAPAEVVGPDLRLTVDTPWDLIVMRKIWSALQREGHLITIAEIVRFLREHPEIAGLNAGENTVYLWK
jgi:N,N'-diacetyllegionaminate synthase